MSNDSIDFPNCPICGSIRWIPVYAGPVRDGAFGESRFGEVRRCSGCGVDRLNESACLQHSSYESTAYRERLGQDHDLDKHYQAHDELARFTLEAMWPASARGKIIADFGCGGGALLDHVRGIARELVAIDPDVAFADSLRSRGYVWFPSGPAAAAAYAGRVDIVLSTQVIEHVADPRAFLADVALVLRPDGFAVVSTPNRNDVLMELMPDSFPAFFYRTQHRWIFDADSLTRCARAAGLEVATVKHVHRYGMSNALWWMKERRPRGRLAMPPIDEAMDKHWQAWLENAGKADNLYILLRRAS